MLRLEGMRDTAPPFSSQHGLEGIASRNAGSTRVRVLRWNTCTESRSMERSVVRGGKIRPLLSPAGLRPVDRRADGRDMLAATRACAEGMTRGRRQGGSCMGIASTGGTRGLAGWVRPATSRTGTGSGTALWGAGLGNRLGSWAGRRRRRAGPRGCALGRSSRGLELNVELSNAGDVRERGVDAEIQWAVSTANLMLDVASSELAKKTSPAGRWL